MRIALISPTGRSGGAAYSEALSGVLDAAVLSAELPVAGLWSTVFRRRYDIVDVQFEYKTFGSHIRTLVALPVLAALLRSSPVGVLTLHGVITRDSLRGDRLLPLKWFGYVLSVRLASLFFRAVLVHSEQMRLSLLRYGITNAIVVPHGSRQAEFSAQEASRRGVLFFGFIRPSKGIADLISGFQLVKERSRDTKLTIAGSVRNEQEASHLAALRRHADDLGLGGSVDFRIGYVSEIDKELANLDVGILVLPYTDRFVEVSGVVHDLACLGTALVCSDTPRFSELRDGVNCLKVGNRPEELAEAVIRLLDDVKLREEISRNLADFARVTSWARVGETRMRLYAQLLGSKSREADRPKSEL